MKKTKKEKIQELKKEFGSKVEKLVKDNADIDVTIGFSFLVSISITKLEGLDGRTKEFNEMLEQQRQLLSKSYNDIITYKKGA